VNEPANHQFIAGVLTAAETRKLLDKWARWHDVRVALGIVATTAAAFASHHRGAYQREVIVNRLAGKYTRLTAIAVPATERWHALPPGRSRDLPGQVPEG
jgi:hypothetical protein